jgi:hypothetical protein
VQRKGSTSLGTVCKIKSGPDSSGFFAVNRLFFKQSLFCLCIACPKIYYYIKWLIIIIAASKKYRKGYVKTFLTGPDYQLEMSLFPETKNNNKSLDCLA